MIKEFKFFNENATPFRQFLHLKMKEGLIHSVGYVFFIDKLKALIKKYNLDHEIFQKEEYVKVSIDIKEKFFINELISLENNTGYFKSAIINKDGNKIKKLSKGVFTIFFNKRFDIPANSPDYLYHATSKHYYEKIKLTGLYPKTQKMISDDLERLYLTDNLAEALSFCTDKRFFIKDKYKKDILFDMNIDEWLILLIDIKSIQDFKLYKDTKMNNSYYTYDVIPAYAIRIEKEINF